jgi:ATP-binding cassette subfamily B protein
MFALASYLKKYFWQYRYGLFWGVIFIALNNYLKIYSTKLIGKTFDVVFKQSDASRALQSKDIMMIALENVGWFLLLSLVSGFFLFLTRQTIIVISRHIEYEMKKEIYKQYQNLDLPFYRKHSTGDLMNRISEDVGRVRMFLGPSIMYGVNIVLVSWMVISSMLDKNKELSFYVLLPLPVLSLAIYYISQRMNVLNHNMQTEQSGLSTFVQEHVSGIRVLAVYGKMPAFYGFFMQQAQRYREAVLKLAVVESWFAPAIYLLVGLSNLLTVYVGGLKVMAGEVTVGDVAEFVVYINLLTWPFASVGWITSLTQAAISSQERINEFLQTKPTLVSLGTEKTDISGNLVFKNVDYIYAEMNIHALRQVSFDLKQGEVLGILGRTGSGKTTLAQLVSRLMDPSAGSIVLDGKPIQDYDVNFLRSNMAYVPQDVFLFSDSIFNNLAMGSLEKVSQEQVEEACKKAEIHDNIMALPKGYQTMLGERGINLSGGQKQRIALARALLKPCPILILDDTLSAVDAETENKIQKHLRQIDKQTVIIISQRISSIRHANQIIVLEDGKIAQKGTHQSLLQEPLGLYARIHQKQSHATESI